MAAKKTTACNQHDEDVSYARKYRLRKYSELQIICLILLVRWLIQAIIATQDGQVVCNKDLLKSHFQLTEDELILVQDVICTEEGQKMLDGMMQIFGVTGQQEKVYTLEVLVTTIDAQWEGMWGCRVGEVRAGTTSTMPNHNGFKLQ